MQKRLFIHPLLYGAILGAASALVASVLFVLAGGAFMFGLGSLNLFTLALGLRLIFTFTALPGLEATLLATRFVGKAFLATFFPTTTSPPLA